MTKKSKTPQESQVEMTEIVFPQHTNPLGTVFGGVVLSWIDIAAGIAAQRHCENIVVTASVDAMHFLAPIHLGWIVSIRGTVNFASKQSCEVGIRIEAENPLQGIRVHNASAYVTMAALDQNRQPTTIPRLIPQTEVEKRRFEEAQMRREARLVLKAKLDK